MAAVPPVIPAAAPEGNINLLQHPHLWRASRSLVTAGANATGSTASSSQFSTGQPVLDNHLANSGWPVAAVTELLHGPEGIGELGLLLPLLAHLTHSEHKWVAWVAPPHMPCGPALAAAGVDVDRLLLIHSKDHKQTLWCLEQALKSGTCSAVLGWPDPKKLQPKEVRRLQVAARQGGTFAFLFRPEAAAQMGSPAELRLQLRPGEVRILKRRGGWATDWLLLEGDLGARREQDQRTPRCRLQDQLTLWRHQRPTGQHVDTSAVITDTGHAAPMRPPGHMTAPPSANAVH